MNPEYATACHCTSNNTPHVAHSYLFRLFFFGLMNCQASDNDIYAPGSVKSIFIQPIVVPSEEICVEDIALRLGTPP